MKLIDLLIKISNNEIEPIIYFRLNYCGHNMIIRYLYYNFKIVNVKSSFSKSIFKKGEDFNFIISALNKKVEIIDYEEGD